MDRYSQIRSNRVCEGCLSINRSFLELDKYEIRMFYKLTDIDSKKDALQLCWECKYILRKFIKFKQQVKHAHVILNTYNHNTLPSLSNLVIKKCKDIKEIVYDDSKKPIDIEISPLTFIKVEDNENDFSFNQFDDDFIMSDSDDRQLKADVKHDLANESEKRRDGGNNDFNESNEEVNIKHDIENESEKEKDANTKDDFNESDDEPLITRKVLWKKKKERKGKNTEPKNKRETSGVINNERINKKLEKLNMASDKLQMVLLTWEEVEEERQKALESESFKRHEYRCYDCAIGFNHRCKLDNHMKKHDPCKGSEECGVCHIRCRDAHALAAHRRRHRLRWRCAECGAAWSRAALGADHVARAHGGPAPRHACRVCGRREPTLAKLRSHVKDHAERPKCELCGKSFRDRTSLRTHLFIHKGEKEYECPRCNKKFLFKKAMEVHLVTHDASALLYCHLCDKNFKNKMSYNQHMKYNLKHIDPEKLKYACQQCPKRFAKASRLREHRLALHLRLAPERCAAPGCAFTSASRAALRTHARMQHRAARLLRNHVCHLCGKTYTTKKCLEGHLRAHSGERPFHCAKCPAAFGYEAALYNHNKLVHLKPKSSRRTAEWLSVAPPAGEQTMET